MEQVDIERDEWNGRAETREGAMHEACSDPERWDESVVQNLSMITPAIITGERQYIFDLGCGPGRLAIPIGNRLQGPGGMVTGIDISRNMLNHLQDEADAAGIDVLSILTNGRTFPDLKSGSHDAGYSVNVFQHLPPEVVQHYLTQVNRILKPGGKFIFQFVEGTETAPFMYQFHDYDVSLWCKVAGYNACSFQTDPNQFNWSWVTVTK